MSKIGFFYFQHKIKTVKDQISQLFFRDQAHIWIFPNHRDRFSEFLKIVQDWLLNWWNSIGLQNTS